jgi:hypothetical protein
VQLNERLGRLPLQHLAKAGYQRSQFVLRRRESVNALRIVAAAARIGLVAALAQRA